jgi:protocatechuate 3,4-dioxygenase beta subunit
MPNPSQSLARRTFLDRSLCAAAFLATPGAFAEALQQTPAQTEGPFYPNHLPLDTDNDLLVINDSITPAVGEITDLSGRILDAAGNPLRNAIVEIWQVDSNAAYLHTRDRNHSLRDGNFQGFGRFLTSSTGEYYFRTIKPVPYPGRTPHIHFAIHRKGADKFTTQCYIKGHPQNDKDGIFVRAAQTAELRRLIEVDFAAIPDSPARELGARFDIVLGRTPAE